MAKQSDPTWPDVADARILGRSAIVIRTALDWDELLWALGQGCRLIPPRYLSLNDADRLEKAAQEIRRRVNAAHTTKKGGR